MEKVPIVEPLDEEEEHWRRPKRKHKRRAILKDPWSTGRKEAARLYPLNPAALCEWSETYIQMTFPRDPRPVKIIVAEIAGCRDKDGDLLPFRICKDNPQTHRHHGPDKNTLNNEPGNVHRICAFCHNLWHAIMDTGYDWENRSD